MEFKRKQEHKKKIRGIAAVRSSDLL